MLKDDIKIDTSSLPAIISKIPKGDFIDVQFDKNNKTTLTDVLILFSTPRSGSTMLTDLLQQNDLCLPHEYFQPFQYLPILAERWGCVESKHVNKVSFLENLIKFRSYPSGWLGINLHGEHLPVFSKFEKIMPDVNQHYIHLVRRDVIAQAISYDIAVQTGRWSSKFESNIDATYNYSTIKSRLNMIQQQNALISAYVKSRNITYKTIYYEDLITDPKNTLDFILPDLLDDQDFVNSTMKKQASNTSEDWAERFSHDYFEHSKKNKLTQSIKFFEDSSKHILNKKFSPK